MAQTGVSRSFLVRAGELRKMSTDRGLSNEGQNEIADNVYSDANNPDVEEASVETRCPWNAQTVVFCDDTCDLCGERGVNTDSDGISRVIEVFVPRTGLFLAGLRVMPTLRCGRIGCHPAGFERERQLSTEELNWLLDTFATPAADVPARGPEVSSVAVPVAGVAPGSVADTSGAIGARSLAALASGVGAEGDAGAYGIPRASVAQESQVAEQYLGKLLSAYATATQPDYKRILVAFGRVARLADGAFSFAGLLEERPDSPLPWDKYLEVHIGKLSDALAEARAVLKAELANHPSQVPLPLGAPNRGGR